MTNPRSEVFAAVAKQVPGIWNDPGNILALDNLLDAFGVPREPIVVVGRDAFGAALKEILKHEGGYVNHPRDPGGRTNLGVTQRVWEAYTGKDASEAEMRSLTVEKVSPVYRKNYWEALRCDDLPLPLALCVFDFGVNAGPARAARYLQTLVGVSADGKVGPVTLTAANTYVAKHGIKEVVRRYQQARREYYRRLATFPTFGRGWLRRVDEVEHKALELAK